MGEISRQGKVILFDWEWGVPRVGLSYAQLFGNLLSVGVGFFGVLPAPCFLIPFELPDVGLAGACFAECQVRAVFSVAQSPVVGCKGK